MQKITMYALKVCPYCVKAKELLTKRGLAFETIMMDSWTDEQWDEQERKNGMKTAPQIYHGDRLIGGYSDLEALDKKDSLESLKK